MTQTLVYDKKERTKDFFVSGDINMSVFFPIVAILIPQLAIYSCIVVDTKSGKIEGIDVTSPIGRPGYAFLGIPYAKPPIGILRFKAPEPVPPWSNVLKADSKPKACIQSIGKNLNPKVDWFVDKESEESEDCLYINIWTAKPLPSQAPVMVWIHPGGFIAGSCSMEKYDGQTLSTGKGVIVVSFNYRLSIFGFLYLNSTVAPGNMGLMDQTMALQWVYDNIEYFGGEFKKITIVGESAGSVSVEHHLFLPASRGLFRRAIMMSGSEFFNGRNASTSSLLSLSKEILSELSCEEGTATCLVEADVIMDVLQSREASKIIEVKDKIIPEEYFLFRPTIDGSFTKTEKKHSMKMGNLNRNINVMIGYTREDGAFFLGLHGFQPEKNNITFSDEQFLDIIKRVTLVKNNQTAELIRFLYRSFEGESHVDATEDGVIHFITDYRVTCGVHFLLQSLRKNGNKAYLYVFTHAPSTRPEFPWFGSTHGDEIDFLFGKPLVETLSYTEEEKELSLQVMEIFSSFARYGEPPKLDNQETWPAYTNEKRQLLNIGVNIKVDTTRKAQHCKFWSTIYPALNEHLEKRP